MVANFCTGRETNELYRKLYPARGSSNAPDQRFRRGSTAAQPVEPAVDEAARQIMRLRRASIGFLLAGRGTETSQRGLKILTLPLARQSRPTPGNLHQNGEADEKQQATYKRRAERDHTPWVSSPPEKRKRAAQAVRAAECPPAHLCRVPLGFAGPSGNNSRLKLTALGRMGFDCIAHFRIDPRELIEIARL